MQSSLFTSNSKFIGPRVEALTSQTYLAKAPQGLPTAPKKHFSTSHRGLTDTFLAVVYIETR